MSTRNQKASDVAVFRFWEPTIEEFWRGKEPSDPSVIGFPCFCAMFLRAVAKGEEGDETSQLLEDLIYIFPNTIPENLQRSFVGVLSSFGTWSRLNLGGVVTSFTWSESEIAVQSLQLSDGNIVLFALKMPKFYTAQSVDRVLQVTLRTYRMMNEFWNQELGSDDLKRLKSAFIENEVVMREFTFKGRKGEMSPFAYGQRPLQCFESKSALAVSTELFQFISDTSDRIVGCALFFSRMVILSSLNHEITCLHPLFKKMVKMQPEYAEERFSSLKVWVPPGIVPDVDSVAPMTMAVIRWRKMTLYMLVKGQDEISDVLERVKALLDNCMRDFAVECEATNVKVKSKATGILQFWPETGVLKKSKCEYSARRMAEACDAFASNRILQEMIVFDGQIQTTSVRFLDVEIFVETEEPKGTLGVQASYAKIRNFVPNLPEEFSKL